MARTATTKIETPDVTKLLQDEIDKQISVKQLVKVLVDGTQATKVVTASFQGKILDESEYIDQPTRNVSALALAKLRGFRTAGGTGVEVEVDNRKRVVIIRPL